LSTRAAGETDRAAKDGGEAVVEVTHEALFKAWPTLDQWLTEEHTFLSDIERIKSAHDIWTQAPDAQRPGPPGGLLLSRARLAAQISAAPCRDIAALRAFIAASAEAEDAEKARTRRIERRIFKELRDYGGGCIRCNGPNRHVNDNPAAADRAKQRPLIREIRLKSTQSLFLADLSRQQRGS
jgi:hypothetical protein